jgi:hypothetical protein
LVKKCTYRIQKLGFSVECAQKQRNFDFFLSARDVSSPLPPSLFLLPSLLSLPLTSSLSPLPPPSHLPFSPPSLPPHFFLVITISFQIYPEKKITFNDLIREAQSKNTVTAIHVPDSEQNGLFVATVCDTIKNSILFLPPFHILSFSSPL